MHYAEPGVRGLHSGQFEAASEPSPINGMPSPRQVVVAGLGDGREGVVGRVLCADGVLHVTRQVRWGADENETGPGGHRLPGRRRQTARGRRRTTTVSRGSATGQGVRTRPLCVGRNYVELRCRPQRYRASGPAASPHSFGGPQGPVVACRAPGTGIVGSGSASPASTVPYRLSRSSPISLRGRVAVYRIAAVVETQGASEGWKTM
jgi:hypothetical protein